jgi:hypothetical protein
MKMKRTGWLLVISALVGCGDDGGAAVDAASVADAAALVDAAAPDAGDCNALAQTAPEVAQARVAEVAPAAVGGALVDGRYHLISDKIYTGVGGATGITGLRSMITSSCSAGLCQQVVSETGTISGGPPRLTLMLGTAGTTLTQRRTCPDNLGGPAATYSVVVGATTTMTIYEAMGVDQRERVYQLQPG